MSKAVITGEDVGRLAGLVSAGYSSVAIAEEFQTTRATINRTCKKFGIDLAGRGDARTTVDTLRKLTETLAPLEAVNLLLEVIENLFPSQDADAIAKLKQRMPYLRPKTIQVLQVLMGRKGSIVSRETIFSCVWPIQQDAPFEKIIDVNIHKLRAAFKIHEPGVTIETSWGVGYRLTQDSRFSWESP